MKREIRYRTCPACGERTKLANDGKTLRAHRIAPSRFSPICQKGSGRYYWELRRELKKPGKL